MWLKKESIFVFLPDISMTSLIGLIISNNTIYGSKLEAKQSNTAVLITLEQHS